MGPVSPATTPSSAVLSNCWVVLAWTVGAGFSVETALRARTSKRGMACVNGWTPNSGLGGRPVGMVEPNAYALLTKGLRPLFATIAPRDLPVGERLQDLPAIFPGVLRFP